MRAANLSTKVTLGGRHSYTLNAKRSVSLCAVTFLFCVVQLWLQLNKGRSQRHIDSNTVYICIKTDNVMARTRFIAAEQYYVCVISHCLSLLNNFKSWFLWYIRPTCHQQVDIVVIFMYRPTRDLLSLRSQQWRTVCVHSAGFVWICW
jgi:hypothetical protein